MARLFLHRLLTPDNMIYVVQEAEGSPPLERMHQVAHEKFLLSFYPVCNTEEFLNWTVKQVESYLGEDRLAIYTELDPFQAIFRWINVRRGERMPYLARLMDRVRFEHMSKRERVMASDFDEVVNANAQVREMLADASW